MFTNRSSTFITLFTTMKVVTNETTNSTNMTFMQDFKFVVITGDISEARDNNALLVQLAFKGLHMLAFVCFGTTSNLTFYPIKQCDNLFSFSPE